MLAGITLAAVSIPVALGYAKIAGMPVVTGLYTLLLPMAVFAVLGSSRHLVVGADSATAAILGAALAGLAVAGSPQYVRLAGLAALLAGGLLLLARLARLGFLANFLSRTVLVGFLTGVGIQVAAGQLPDMLGVTAAGKATPARLLDIARALPQAHAADLAVSAGVIVIVLAARAVSRKIPGLLIAVIAAIIVSRAADLAGHGVAVLGPVPRGLPHLGLPALGWHDAAACSAPQRRCSSSSSPRARRPHAPTPGSTRRHSARTPTWSAWAPPTWPPRSPAPSSSTAARPRHRWPTARAGAASWPSSPPARWCSSSCSCSPGRWPSLPIAALAAVVFLIAVGLIDVRGMRRILACRRHEFAIALLTTAAVVILGVEEGIVLAVVASVIDHLRHSYHPLNSVLVKSPAGHWQPAPVQPGARTEEGLVVYRFGTSLYYANASRLIDDVTALAAQGSPLRWMVLDGAAIGDVDYTAAAVLTRVIEHLRKRHIRFAVSSVLGPVRKQLDRYGISAALGPGAYYDTPGEALEAFHAAEGSSASKRRSKAAQQSRTNQASDLEHAYRVIDAIMFARRPPQELDAHSAGDHRTTGISGGQLARSLVSQMIRSSSIFTCIPLLSGR